MLDYVCGDVGDRTAAPRPARIAILHSHQQAYELLLWVHVKLFLMYTYHIHIQLPPHSSPTPILTPLTQIWRGRTWKSRHVKSLAALQKPKPSTSRKNRHRRGRGTVLHLLGLVCVLAGFEKTYDTCGPVLNFLTLVQFNLLQKNRGILGTHSHLRLR